MFIHGHTQLLFPLEWLSCYIPRLPNKLHEILDAPGSFVLGIYTEGEKPHAAMKNVKKPKVENHHAAVCVP